MKDLRKFWKTFERLCSMFKHQQKSFLLEFGRRRMRTECVFRKSWCIGPRSSQGMWLSPQPSSPRRGAERAPAKTIISPSYQRSYFPSHAAPSISILPDIFTHFSHTLWTFFCKVVSAKKSPSIKKTCG